MTDESKLPEMETIPAPPETVTGRRRLLGDLVAVALEARTDGRTRERIINVALAYAELATLPESPFELAPFIDEPLCDAIEDVLGLNVAVAVAAELSPLMHAAALHRHSGVFSVNRADGVDPADGGRRTYEEAQPASDKTTTVLVVDDDRVYAASTKRLLQAQGWHVVVACDGYDALRRCVKYDADVVVSDYEMPLMRGDELATLLHQVFQEDAPPLLLVSGADPRKMDRKHIADMITKGDSPKRLLSLVRGMLTYDPGSAATEAVLA
jgi:CheY-like chemotaxis protein